MLCSRGFRNKNINTVWSRVQPVNRLRGKCSFPIEMTSGDYGNVSQYKTKSSRMMENVTFKRGPEERKVTLGQGVGMTTRVGSGV